MAAKKSAGTKKVNAKKAKTKVTVKKVAKKPVKAKAGAKKVASKATKKVAKKASPAKASNAKVKRPAKINDKLTKTQLIVTLAERCDLEKKVVANLLNELEDLTVASLKGIGEFNLAGMMKVKVKHVPKKPARMGRNPATGETIKLKAKPASKKVKILPLKKLKEVV